MPDRRSTSWPGRVAVGIVRTDPPEVIVATDDAVLSRVLALQVVARTAADRFTEGDLRTIRAALLNEEWATAVGTWIQATGIAVDAYPDDICWNEERLDLESASVEIRLSPIFEDTDPPSTTITDRNS